MKIGKDRKIKVQQKIIEDLQKEKQKLIEENEELKEQLEFEKFIQQITIGNAMGRNTLSKNRY